MPVDAREIAQSIDRVLKPGLVASTRIERLPARQGHLEIPYLKVAQEGSRELDVTLTTERLVLRRITGADVEDLVALHNDPAVMRFLTGGKAVSREQVEREVDDVFSKEGYWAAVERGTGAFLGWFAFHPTPDRDPGQRELGYRLRRSVWGKGFATEGSRALIERGFQEPEVRRVWAQTMAVNIPSRRVMEKAGLTFERVFHVAWDDPLPGTDQGEVEYGLDRADWERHAMDGAPPSAGTAP